MKRLTIIISLTASLFVLSASVYSQDVAALKQTSTFPGAISDWFGFEQHDFQFAGRAAKVVFPQEQAQGGPWLWRARFFGHEPQFDVAMLKKGYSLVYLDSAPLAGAPRSVALWQEFYLYVTSEFKLGKKANLEGMSRGALYAINWAFAYPDEVASIYLDNPVLDVTAFQRVKGEEATWAEVLKSYEMTEKEARKYKKSPKDNKEGCEALAKRNVGILLICGDADQACLADENWKPFKALYESVGGPIELILKPGVGHHPHSLKDPTPIVEFVEKFNRNDAQ